jgi:hypothetical protein
VKRKRRRKSGCPHVSTMGLRMVIEEAR